MPEGNQPGVGDKRKAYDFVVVRRKIARDTSISCSGKQNVLSSNVGEYSSHHSVRRSILVEIGQVKYVPETMPAPELRRSNYGTWRPGKRKRNGS